MEWVVLSAGRYGSECVEYSIHPLYIHSNFEVSGIKIRPLISQRDQSFNMGPIWRLRLFVPPLNLTLTNLLCQKNSVDKPESITLKLIQYGILFIYSFILKFKSLLLHSNLSLIQLKTKNLRIQQDFQDLPIHQVQLNHRNMNLKFLILF